MREKKYSHSTVRGIEIVVCADMNMGIYEAREEVIALQVYNLISGNVQFFSYINDHAVINKYIKLLLIDIDIPYDRIFINVVDKCITP